MGELLSVGLDVGTTTTQFIVSRLKLQNRAAAFAVPKMEITGRQVVYRSPVRFTPLKGESLVDGEGLRQMVTGEFAAAGITPGQVDTGAVIITGETSRRENARQVLEALSELAGDFVVAAAGPHLESVLAAKGAGAVEFSKDTEKQVLHMDIGGGTANLALIHRGQILRTGCLNVGGRLLKLEKTGAVGYSSPVLEGLWQYPPGSLPPPGAVEALAKTLAEALEMAAGLRPAGALLEKLTTRETGEAWLPPGPGAVISFSGGVADCIREAVPSGAFGDIGPELGRAIRNSLLCQGAYILGEETVRATVIGAGCHSAQLSGSTVFLQNLALPLKNLPVAVFTRQEQEADTLPGLIAQRMAQKEAETVVLALPGYAAASYAQVSALADKLIAGCGSKPVCVALEQDMAKALGHALQLRLGDVPCLCLDGLALTGECFLDVAQPQGPCIPVVIKTLVLGQQHFPAK